MSTVKIWIDPITRIEGHLALYAEIDTGTRAVKTARTTVMAFRGFEVFLRGRPPEDAPHIVSRTCGVCGAAHANASVIACDIAAGMTPYPMGSVLRTLAYSMTDYIYDHPLILNMLEGPDYSEVIISKLTPSVWKVAQETPANYTAIHGYRTIADIMKDLNPITGKIWQLTVKYQRIAREAGALIYGRHAHPSTLIPGGISTDITNLPSLLQEYYARLSQLTAWVKFVWAVWQDLYEFYRDHVTTPDGKPYATTQGKTHDPPVMLAGGFADDPEVYSNITDEARGNWRELYARLDQAYNARGEKPGFAIGHDIYSKNPTEIQLGYVEFADSSFYEDWVKSNVAPPTGWIKEDPIGRPLVNGTELFKYHMWNRTTIPKPGAINFAEKYSWAAEPRLVLKDGRIAPIETGPISQLWLDTLHATKFELAGFKAWESNGSQMKIYLPGGTVAPDLPPGTKDELVITWNLPKYSTTFERLLARAVHLAVVNAIAWANLLYGLQLVNAGKVQTSRPWSYGKWPDFSYSFGWWQVPRGNCMHWLVQKGGRIVNYQYEAPTTPNVSPSNNRCTDPWKGQCAGPFEMSVRNSVVTEELPPDQWTGLDQVRAIRSFDPCLACAVHFEAKGEGGRVMNVIEKVIWNACAI
ncbi:nickel-dependent hydrogenase, large subunit [Pyrobaculum islandicum DSM 4184]|uniref:Nickel-dependent hydrogenase, large subunit n=1 Tax=Pyrobaculum islandicum (strain DSM 4184 / JCM 9189 / GEO3) TaxID=384616 RepID=A1RQZ7_PYRIL|nr:nickel-dependent hydrogenase large subunit [Pyrobaculum islandicum]ABL87379.1 nickel-dependent hydrogenase, large subunit [Pyrobaculum islandicum DSM 4184]